jgi:hypothetical protein
MDEQQISGNLCKYISLLVLNLLTFFLGIGIFVTDILIWTKVKSFNSFNMTLTFIALYIIFTCLIGCKLRCSPTKLIIYFLLVFLVLTGVTILLMFILFDQDQIITFLIHNMKDSKAAIDEAKYYLDQNIDVIKILLLSYLGILVAYSII